MDTFFTHKVSNLEFKDFNFLEHNESALNFARQFAYENISYNSDNDELLDDYDELEIINSDTTNTEINEEIEIVQIQTSNLSPCAVLDTIDGNIQKCNSTYKLRGVWQLVGIWQLDHDVVIQTGKSNTNVEQSIIHNRRCKFCNKNYYFFSRGKYCKEHSWELTGKQIRTACIAQKECNLFQELNSIMIKAESNENVRYVCCHCFEKQGGHLYVQPGKGKAAFDCIKENIHLGETSLALELMSKWILYVAQNENLDYQEKVLTLITPALQQLNSKFEQSISQKSPSLFVFQCIFNDFKFNEKVEIKKPKDWYHTGTDLANSIWMNRKYIRDHKTSLKTPQCLKEYSSAIPPFLYNFFEGLIHFLLSKRCQIANETQKRQKKLIALKKIDDKKVEKITTMLSSIILTSSFTNTQFWLTRSLASLYRKPRLSFSLH
ncbi:hypothetical protein Glove_115g57 [Diversispora epigaea]|uniref:Uncharacterized protein n=1 Tax=Diversispora epigaea TaxID=1348612 RepID=A0A397J4Q1_9GLOM|nr:hypothetical protein Glove_115g57 [Diversispora epigaea]